MGWKLESGDGLSDVIDELQVSWTGALSGAPHHDSFSFVFILSFANLGCDSLVGVALVRRGWFRDGWREEQVRSKRREPITGMSLCPFGIDIERESWPMTKFSNPTNWRLMICCCSAPRAARFWRSSWYLVDGLFVSDF